MDQNQFSERTLQGFEDLSQHQLIGRLQKSKIVQKWIKFYAEWFGIKVNLADFKELMEPQGAGWNTIVMPKEITLTNASALFSQKLKYFTNILEEGKIRELRGNNDSYVTYAKYGMTVLELLVFDLFQMFQGKSILPKKEGYSFKHSLSDCGKGTQIYIHVTDGSAMLKATYAKGNPIKGEIVYEIWEKER
ncbi:MAG: hypothetical protein WCO65_03755 [bacterium]